MDNPWLHIPLGDYEGHMNLAQVGQAMLLADVLEAALRRFKPRSVAVLGCAGGNGFERIDPSTTPRVVGIDINPAYVEEARRRFEGRFRSLELIVRDIQTSVPAAPPVEFVYAGLLFEYVDPDRTIARIGELLAPDGVLVSVLQLPSEAIPEVTPSPYASLERLGSAMQLVSPAALSRHALRRGFLELEHRTCAATGGKAFGVQTFRLGRTTVC